MALADLFTDIANAIREKDGTTDAIVANTFPARIQAIPTGSKPGTPLDPVQVYKDTRPADWLPMPTPNGDEMYLLFHIPDGVSSLLAFTVTCTGNYTVALGTVADGAFVQQSAVSVASGSKYEAELFSDDYGDLTSDGMKQVMIKISGTDILTWELSTHSKKTSPNNFSRWNIVEIFCNLPSGTKVACGDSNAVHSLPSLRYFSWNGTNNVKNFDNMFNGCSNLTAVLFLNTEKAVSMVSTFANCSNLISISELNTAMVTDMGSMFRSCRSLIAIHAFDTSNVKNFDNMFNGCSNLTAVLFLNTEKAVSMVSTFANCSNLISISGMDLSDVISFDGVFNTCVNLKKIPKLKFVKALGISSSFNRCDTLCKIELDPTVTNWAGASISFSGCSLGHQALVDLFNSLPTITSSKSLTITGNPGVSELTNAEKAIATGKNWTLTL